jgi:hypothetical protein
MRSIKNGAAAVALAAVLAACSADEEPATGLPADRADATTTTAPDPAPPRIGQIAEGTPLDPGTYVLAAVRRDDMPLAVLDVPEGFRAGGVFLHTGVEEEPGTFGAIGYFKASGIFKDPCTKGGRHPLGPSVDDLAAGLASQTMLSPTTPVPVSIGSHEGVYFEMTAPRLDYSRCKWNDVTFWDGEDGGTGPFTDTAGTKVGVWILDVDGNRAVLNTFVQPGLSRDQADALAKVVESARFTTTDVSTIP